MLYLRAQRRLGIIRPAKRTTQQKTRAGWIRGRPAREQRCRLEVLVARMRARGRVVINVVILLGVGGLLRGGSLARVADQCRANRLVPLVDLAPPIAARAVPQRVPSRSQTVARIRPSGSSDVGSVSCGRAPARENDGVTPLALSRLRNQPKRRPDQPALRPRVVLHHQMLG